MKAVIIEDEKPAARLLSNMLHKLRPYWEIETIPGSIEAACDWFAAREHPDIIFLDINLSDGNSFLFIEQAKPQGAIIFTTAYDEYALRAFTVNSIDYLLKPIKRERLEEAIVKYERLINTNRNATSTDDILMALRQITTPGKKYRTRFLIDGFKDNVTLDVADIAYFYLINKITMAVTTDSHEYVIDVSLDKLMEQLDPDQFFRANRQTIINIHSVAKIEPWFGGKIIVETKPRSAQQITISRERVSLFKVWLNY